jgi:Pentapeptide repeats (8 copies)
VVLDRYADSWFIADSSLRGYDGSQGVRDEERHVTTEPPRAADPQERSSRGPRLGFIVALAICAAVVIVIIYGYLAKPGWIGSSGKQFWDYLDLLIVPAALALGVYWLNRRQTERAQQAEAAQQERALAVESLRAQDEALQAYLDQMAQLLTDKERPLHEAQPGDSLSIVARARTLTVLGRLDSGRKRSVLEFLYESRLIDQEQALLHQEGLIERRHNIVSLRQADLRGVYLSWSYLIGADLSWSYLREADIRGANLDGTDLSATNLTYADLAGAFLSRADLSWAITGGADLSGADLTDITGWTEEQLRAAKSLEGATLPDGQTLQSDDNPDGPTFEEWLKSRLSGEDEKNE